MPESLRTRAEDRNEPPTVSNKNRRATAPLTQPTSAEVENLIGDLETDQPTEVGPINRFLLHFPVERVIIKTNLQPNGKPWSDGTIPRQLASVLIEVGETGAFFAARIQHLKFTDGTQKVDLMLPSTSRNGGLIHVPMIDTGGKGSATDEAMSEWKTLVVNRFIAMRQAAVASGAPTLASSTRTSGVSVGDALLDSLGIVAAKPAEPAPQPTTAEPVAV